MVYRYIAKVGQVDIQLLGPGEGLEMWMGFESRDQVDLEEFSREMGCDLIPADGMSEDELRSVGVREFQPLDDE